jgi:hypothetical protein
MLTSKFVFSPRGHGWQSHRDWEALLAGAVPLLDAREGYDEALWKGLPVRTALQSSQPLGVHLNGALNALKREEK